MPNPFKFLIRISSFLSKELTEIFRQPRLILILILGPFLIMFLFGLGYPDQTRALRTLFVVSNENPVREQVESFAALLQESITFEGIESDREVAIAKLAFNQADMVVVVPENPLETIRNNRQAEFLIFHNEVDPYQVGYVRFVGNELVDEMNRQVLQSMTAQGQEEAASVQTSLQAALENARALREALERGDITTALSQREQLSSNIDLVTLAIGVGLGMDPGASGSAENGAGTTDPAGQEILATLEEVNQNAAGLEGLNPNSSGTDMANMATQVAEMEADLSRLNEQLTEFQALEPGILVSPFTYRTSPLAEVEYTPTGFFTPAVIVLLLQHLAITFSALSIVRERNSGVIELFRASPITAFETLTGKFLSYLLFEILLGAVITFLVVWLLGVPIRGDWTHYAAAVVALLFTSLGLGFLLSLVSETDTQAVQYAMLVLLASIFFSGFFMDLRLMWQPMTLLAWSLPATYGIRMLQDIMLRGYSLPALVFQGITAIGLGLFLLDWWLLNKRMKSQ